MRYFIACNEDKKSKEVFLKIKNFLKDYDSFIFTEENPEIVISIGGDGRFLKIIRKFLPIIEQVGFVGISTGKLGYLCDYKSEEVDDFLHSFVSKTPYYDGRNLIKMKIGKDEDYFLNECRIEKIFRTLETEVLINDEYFENYSGNGLIFSSPTGSTAYCRSLNGPIINFHQSGFLMGEIAPIISSISNSLNSFLLLSDKDKVTLKGDFNMCSIGGDHFNFIVTKQKIEEIEISLSDKKVVLAHYKKFDFYEKLKNSFIKRS